MSKEPLEKRARDLLDESVEHLDAATLSRLNQARQRALEAARRRASPSWQWWGLPAGGLAVAVLAVAVWWPRTAEIETPVSVMEDMEILVSADIEMLEDLEFFMWLDEADEDAG